MDRSQDSHARRVISQAMTDGGWVVLQNGHFHTDFLTNVLAQITSADTVHGEFRLWITSESCNRFPVNFLQVSTH